MKTHALLIPAILGLAAIGQAQAPAKPATIHVQNAILSTKEGQKAQTELQNRFTARRAALEKKQSEITTKQDQYKKGSATMSQDARDKLMRDIDGLQTAFKRDTEDFDADVQQEEGKIMNDLGGKILEVISKYATQNGITMVVDISNPQSAVLWADASIDITNEIVKLYDQAHPDTAATPAAAKPPAVPPAKPPAAPPAKKQ